MTVDTANRPTLTQESRAVMAQLERQAKSRRLWTIGLVLILLAGSALALIQLEDRSAGTFRSGLAHLGDFFDDYLPPLDREVLFTPARISDRNDMRLETLDGERPPTGSLARWQQYIARNSLLLIETLNIAVLSTLLGAVIGLVLAFLGSFRFSPAPWVRVLARRMMEICRSVPDLIIALLFLYFLGRNALPGIIAIGVHTIGALGKLYSEVIDNASDGPVQGIRATGASWAQSMRYGILPQILPNIVSYGLLRLEINLRVSTILGFIGVGGIGYQIFLHISQTHFNSAFAGISLVLVAIVLIDSLSAYLRERIIGRQGAH